VQPEERRHELRRNRASDAARREREEEVAIARRTLAFMFCRMEKPDESEYSHAENDNCNRGHFDDGKAVLGQMP